MRFWFVEPRFCLVFEDETPKGCCKVRLLCVWHLGNPDLASICERCSLEHYACLIDLKLLVLYDETKFGLNLQHIWVIQEALIIPENRFERLRVFFGDRHGSLNKIRFIFQVLIPLKIRKSFNQFAAQFHEQLKLIFIPGSAQSPDIGDYEVFNYEYFNFMIILLKLVLTMIIWTDWVNHGNKTRRMNCPKICRGIGNHIII